MKKHVIIVSTLIPIITSFAQEAIKPVVARSFGEVITIEAQFIEKPNSYYAKNTIKEPFYLEVMVVNGKKLAQPVVIEYILHESGNEKVRIEKKGLIQKLEAYETLRQPVLANPFIKPGEQRTSFVLTHTLHIRRISANGKPVA